ncbi:MAG: hypothetical protein AAFU79_02060 [Myxococcota bacterium]
MNKHQALLTLFALLAFCPTCDLDGCGPTPLRQILDTIEVASSAGIYE